MPSIYYQSMHRRNNHVDQRGPAPSTFWTLGPLVGWFPPIFDNEYRINQCRLNVQTNGFFWGQNVTKTGWRPDHQDTLGELPRLPVWFREDGKGWGGRGVEGTGIWRGNGGEKEGVENSTKTILLPQSEPNSFASELLTYQTVLILVRLPASLVLQKQ